MVDHATGGAIGGRRDEGDPNPKDGGKHDVGSDGDTGKRTGETIDPGKWENQKHWDDETGGTNQ